MYSGISGEQIKVDIFIGVVYYQRLRHMVSDKSQARATGPVDILTHQPVKGRKRGGGIRFGEMERDSMLSHGAAFNLNDRLFKSSDYSEGYVCDKCGSILSCYVSRSIEKRESTEVGERKILMSERASCKVCKENSKCKKVAMPFVMRYLTNELAAMGVKIKYLIKDH